MYSTVLEYLEKTESNFPNKDAFVDLEEAITFKDLKLGAQKIGSFLAKRIKTCEPVVAYMDKKAYNVIAFLGIAYAGCFYVPIDSQMPIERINLILNTLKPKAILFDDATRDKLNGLDYNGQSYHYKTCLETEIDQNCLGQIRSNAKNTDLLYVLFTSGSTGTPKGVTISHAAVIDFMEWICDAYKLDNKNSFCNQAPFYFDASVPDLYIPLKTGSTVFIPPKTYYTFPKKILQYIEEKQINTLVWVPSALCNVVNCKAFNVCQPKSIKLVIFCGEVMPCKHLNVWKHYVPNALYVNMYGPTEATYACMYYDIDRDFEDDEKLPLGRACGNSNIILINDKNELASNGEIGEICILGICLSQGYYNAPEKTSAAFVQNPVNKRWLELMYRTGDLAYIDEKGEMIFAGRKDFQIKRLGHRIELGEIENVISSFQAVSVSCCVFNPKNSDIIAIYVGDISEEQLNHELVNKLPHYMLPTKYVKLGVMPMNLNGKIDRNKLKTEYTEN